MYVDNGIIFGADPEKVDGLLHQMVTVVREAGLPVHEVEPASDCVEVLGWRIDGQQKRLSVRPRRAWRLRQALEWLLRRETASSEEIEKIVGHCTFMGLACRPALAVFSSSYVFIARHGGSGSASLWPSVRRELIEFQGIIPLISANLASEPSDKVFCMDASMAGYGVVSKQSSGSKPNNVNSSFIAQNSLEKQSSSLLLSQNSKSIKLSPKGSPLISQIYGTENAMVTNSDKKEKPKSSYNCLVFPAKKIFKHSMVVIR